MISAVILFFIAYALAVWFVYQVMDDQVSQMLYDHLYTAYRVRANGLNPDTGSFVRQSDGRWGWINK